MVTAALVGLAACTGPGSASSPSASSVTSGASVATDAGPSASITPSEPEPSPSAAVAEVPDGFPLPPGAVEAPPPGGVHDPIGSWRVEMSGPDLFAFYLAELPAAGFEVVGQYPGGGVGAIVFELDSGVRLQVTMEATDDLGSSEFQLLPDEER
jgi:hypothetical protein